MAKPVLAIDLDEVIGQFVPSLANFHNDTYGTNLTAADFNSYHFRDVWGGDHEESVQKVHSFFDSEHFRQMPTVPGALEALTALKESFSLVIVTSRQHVIEEETRQWVDRHFNGLFDRVLFGNHWGLTGEKRSKPDMCREINAVALVDDSTTYAMQCSETLDKVILFGDYAWNQHTEPLPPAVVRVTDWTQAREHLMQLL